MTQDIENEALKIVEAEVTNYKDGQFFVTEDVAIATRPLIRHLRRNYWGIPEKETDPITGRKIQWVPLSALVANSVRNNADLDMKDLNYRARHRDGAQVTSLVRGFVRKYLKDMNLGERLNETILRLCIDGTAIWKTYMAKDGKKFVLKRTDVDILNFFIDPTADSIQSAQRVTERSLLTPMDIQAMNGWMNTDDIKGKTGLHRTEMDLLNHTISDESVDVYELWGLIPKRLITGNKDDTELIHGHVVVSGIETGDRRVHLIEENTNKDNHGNVIKPYEEVRYIKVPGRWAGVGPVEQVMHLQDWLQTIVNLRIAKNTHASLGLFKIRAGSGITQQMLRNLVNHGVIKLNNMDDFENLRIDEASESSYRDEEVAKSWAFDVTSTHDISRGASLPASTTATTAVIEDRNSKTAYTIVIEQIGLFLERWSDNQLLPHVPKLMRQEKTVTLFSDFDDIDALRERVATYLVMEEMDKNKLTYVPSPEELDFLIQETTAKLRQNKDLFLDVVEDIITENCETVAQFTNEGMDTAVMVKNLIDMSQLVPPEASRDFVMEALDLLGVEIPESLRMAAPANSMQQTGLPSPMQQSGVPSEQSITTEANTL